MTGGELDELIRQVVASGTLLEVGSEGGGSQQPKELLRSTMTANSAALDKFLTGLGEGLYDTAGSKSKVSQSLSSGVSGQWCVTLERRRKNLRAGA